MMSVKEADSKAVKSLTTAFLDVYDKNLDGWVEELEKRSIINNIIKEPDKVYHFESKNVVVDNAIDIINKKWEILGINSLGSKDYIKEKVIYNEGAWNNIIDSFI